VLVGDTLASIDGLLDKVMEGEVEGSSDGLTVGLFVGHVPHVSLHTSLAGPTPSNESVFLQTILTFLSFFPTKAASFPQVLNFGTPSFIFRKNTSSGLSEHDVG